MTKQELLNLKHLAIAEEIPDMYIHIKAEEGWIIAENIKNIRKYSGTTEMCCPIQDEYPDYYMVTLENHNSYKAESDKFIEAESKKQPVIEPMKKNTAPINK